MYEPITQESSILIQKLIAKEGFLYSEADGVWDTASLQGYAALMQKRLSYNPTPLSLQYNVELPEALLRALDLPPHSQVQDKVFADFATQKAFFKEASEFFQSVYNEGIAPVPPSDDDEPQGEEQLSSQDEGEKDTTTQEPTDEGQEPEGDEAEDEGQEPEGDEHVESSDEQQEPTDTADTATAEEQPSEAPTAKSKRGRK